MKRETVDIHVENSPIDEQVVETVLPTIGRTLGDTAPART